MLKFVLLSAFLVGEVAVAADNKRDNERFEDQWTIVSFTYRGESVERFRGETIVFEDGSMTREGKDGIVRGMYRIRPALEPKQVDLVLKNEEKNCTARGIYKFDDDKLIICYAPFDQPRASKFESKEENGNVLVVLEPVPSEE